MTTASVFYPHAIDLDAGTNVISELTDVTPAINSQDIVEYSAAETAPMYGGSFGAIPDINFTTPQIKTILDLIDTEGVSKDLSAANVDLWYRKGAASGSRTATATLAHERYRLTTNAMMILGSLEASQGAVATVRTRLLPIWDGSTVPMVFTGSLALSGTSAASEFFTLGKVDLNGTDIGAVQSLSIDYQVEMEEVQDSGEPYISYGAIRRFAPRVTITTRDTTLLGTYGVAGTALTASDFYFRKLNANGNVVADVTAGHIKLNATAGVIRAREISGVPESMVSIEIDLLKPDATTAPLVITSTAVAIT